MKTFVAQTLIFTVLVILMTLTAQTTAQYVRCYNCTGVKDSDACGRDVTFDSPATSIQVTNCTTGGCSKIVTKIGDSARVERNCALSAVEGKTCVKVGSEEICTHTCRADLCNESDVLRYSMVAALASMSVALLAKRLR